MTDQEAFDTAVRWVTAAHAGRGTSIDKLFAEVARVRDRLLGMGAGKGDGPPRDRYGLTAYDVAAAVEAMGPLPDPPAHPGGIPGLDADQRRAMTVTEDRVICLECGKPVIVLKQHLAKVHDMVPSVYLARWSLAEDFPFAPTAYIESRRDKALGQGLGVTVGHGEREGNRRAGQRQTLEEAMTRLALGSSDPAPVKRGPGRPRKHPLPGTG